MEHHDKAMEHICSSLCTISEALDCNVSGEGIDRLDTREVGQVADIIKDLTEAKKNLCKAWYYHEIAEAMESAEDDGAEHRYGYTSGMADHGMSGMHEMIKSDRYGKAYGDYMASRHRYSESKSPMDKDDMEMHANEHLTDMMTSVREIFKSADPEMRKQAKANLAKFVSELPS